MKADESTRAAIIEALQGYWDAYARHDLDGALGFFVNDPDAVHIGTGVDEKYLGLESLKAGFKRDFAQSESASLQITWSSVSAAGEVAWLAADCLVKVKVSGGELVIPGRLTAVFEHRQGRWLMAQSHFSLPASQQPTGESFPHS